MDFVRFVNIDGMAKVKSDRADKFESFLFKADDDSGEFEDSGFSFRIEPGMIHDCKDHLVQRDCPEGIAFVNSHKADRFVGLLFKK